MKIQIKVEPGAIAPRYMSVGAAGMDLCAHIPELVWLDSGEVAKIPVGISVALPEGYELQIRPRSGLAWKHGITLLNSPGTIDSDYRGEIHVLLVNLGGKTVPIVPGARIAQAVLAKYSRAQLIEVEVLPATERDSGGFGSTGG